MVVPPFVEAILSPALLHPVRVVPLHPRLPRVERIEGREARR